LSDEFLEEVKTLKQKNLAYELLQRLIKESIRLYMRKNLVKSRKFSEMLEEAIRRYQSRTIETTQVILELIELAKKMSEENKNDDSTGMTSDEIAFYDALAENKTARDVMGDVQLKKIAVRITQEIKKNLTVDWSIRDSVQAEMRTIVKKILRQEGYPPDDPKEPNNYNKSVDIIMKQTMATCEEQFV
jgi:type I restriction enzyme R subunit